MKFFFLFLLVPRLMMALKVERLVVVDPSDQREVGTLEDAGYIVEMEVKDAAIRAEATSDVGSIRFALKGPVALNKMENVAPFSLFGDRGGILSKGSLQLGDYELTATPYSRDDGQGDQGEALTVKFTVTVEPVPKLKVERFVVVDPSNQREVGTLEDAGYIVEMEVEDAAILAEATSDVGSIRLALKGPVNVNKIENVAPLSLFGDRGGILNKGNLQLGDYELTATPYSRPYGRGDQGEALTVKFTVTVDDPAPIFPTAEVEEVDESTNDPGAAVRFVLMEPNTNRELRTLTAGSVLFSTYLYAISCATSGKVESVRFELNGPRTENRIENGAPFSLFGDFGGRVQVGYLPPGDYTLTARVYEEGSARGQEGQSLTIQFSATDVGSLVVDAPEEAPEEPPVEEPPIEEPPVEEPPVEEAQEEEAPICFSDSRQLGLSKFPLTDRIQFVPAPVEDSSQFSASYNDAKSQTQRITVQKPRIESVVTLSQDSSESDDQFFERFLDLARNVTTGTHFKFPNKVYRVSFLQKLEGVEDIIIDGQGAKIVFLNPYEGGWVLRECSRIWMRNLRMAFDGSGENGFPPIFSLGKVENDLLVVDRPPRSPDTQIGFLGIAGTNGDVWGYNSSGYADLFPPRGATVGNWQVDLSRFNGRDIIVRHHTRERVFIYTRDCFDLTFMNLEMSNGPGKAMVMHRAKGLYFSKVAVGRDCDSPASVTADSLLMVAASDVIVDRVDFTLHGDDCINIHTKILAFEQMDRKPDTLLFTDRNTREFWHFYTTLHRPDGQHDDRFLMYYDSQMLQIGTGRVASIDFGAYEITTKDTIPAGTRFVIVDDTVPERVLIQNNHFHHHRARGVLLQGRDHKIQNNHFNYNSMSGILVDPETTYWNQGPGVQNLAITDNVFTGTTAARRQFASITIEKMRTRGNPETSGFNRDILIQDNVFEDVFSGINLDIFEGRL